MLHFVYFVYIFFLIPLIKGLKFVIIAVEMA